MINILLQNGIKIHGVITIADSSKRELKDQLDDLNFGITEVKSFLVLLPTVYKTKETKVSSSSSKTDLLSDFLLNLHSLLKPNEVRIKTNVASVETKTDNAQQVENIIGGVTGLGEDIGDKLQITSIFDSKLSTYRVD